MPPTKRVEFVASGEGGVGPPTKDPPKPPLAGFVNQPARSKLKLTKPGATGHDDARQTTADGADKSEAGVLLAEELMDTEDRVDPVIILPQIVDGDSILKMFQQTKEEVAKLAKRVCQEYKDLPNGVGVDKLQEFVGEALAAAGFTSFDRDFKAAANEGQLEVHPPLSRLPICEPSHTSHTTCLWRCDRNS